MYNNTYDQQGDDSGGAKLPVDVPLIWTGERVGAEGSSTVGDTFTVNQVWHGFATDPWFTEQLVTNLNVGDWNLHVSVNGMPLTCPTAIALATGPVVNVTFEISKESGVFTGCSH